MDLSQKYYCPLHYAIQYDNFSTFCLMVEKSYSLEEEMKVRNLCLLNEWRLKIYAYSMASHL